MKFRLFHRLALLFLVTILTNCGPNQVDPPTLEVDMVQSDQANPTAVAGDQPNADTVEARPTKISVQPVIEKNYRPLILVHYMPWYQTLSGSAYWGWHWTMDHFNPRQADENGRLSIASHFYPLTGPYDSGDADVLEYQVMLMKLSGIDGVIVDWYGFESFWDYGKINASTHKLFKQIERAGLLFAITYEDRTVQNMLENSHPNVTDPLVHGQEVMQYLQENWFSADAYLKVSNRPVLFVFGNPPFFDLNSDWETLFSGLIEQPFLITQDDRVVSLAVSGFPWPPMHLAGGSELSRNALENYLNNFYSSASGWEYMTASVFPGFHDIYQEAGVGSSYGYIDANEGETLRYTFDRAFENDPDLIQVVTWNDYGEGTNIEPTDEYGYQYLEMIQHLKVDSIDGGFPYTAEDLKLPFQIFNLRKKHKGDDAVNIQLDAAVNAVLAGEMELARTVLAGYQ